jgi:hypothetical protein
MRDRDSIDSSYILELSRHNGSKLCAKAIELRHGLYVRLLPLFRGFIDICTLSTSIDRNLDCTAVMTHVELQLRMYQEAHLICVPSWFSSCSLLFRTVVDRLEPILLGCTSHTNTIVTITHLEGINTNQNLRSQIPTGDRTLYILSGLPRLDKRLICANFGIKFVG